jgi:large repetitive protein
VVCTPGSPLADCFGDGSGAVNLDRNLIQSNFSGDDGGGLYVLDALGQPINVRNNMIVDNGAADIGGAITLSNSANVRIINNSVANNVTTSTAEDSDGLPHSAGLASEKNHDLWQAAQGAGAARFSNPTALFNNIFWQNNAFTLSQPGPGATLVDGGFIDFEVHATGDAGDRFFPRWSLITANAMIYGDGVTRPIQPPALGNVFGADPLFVTPFVLELTVMGSRLDPQTAMVTITGADPPVGLTGDYHIQTASPAVDRGAGFSDLPFVAGGNFAAMSQTPGASSILAPCSGTLAQSYPADYDRQFRPQLRVNARVRVPWDIGADELAGTGTPAPRTLAIPGTYTQGPDATFNWNGSGQLQCSASTETR